MGCGVMECRPENAGRKVYCRQFSGSEADNATVRHGDALSRAVWVCTVSGGARVGFYFMEFMRMLALMKANALMRSILTSLSAWCGFWLTSLMQPLCSDFWMYFTVMYYSPSISIESRYMSPQKMSSMLFIFLYSTMSPLLSKGYMLSPTM